MLQITNRATLAKLDEDEIARYQKQWKEQRAIVLPKLISPRLLKLLQTTIAQGEFNKIKHDGVDATELSLKRGATIDLMEMLTSEPILTEIISKITGKKPIGNFHGRVYNISKSDHDDWHQDTAFDYLMAMSINLSPKAYKGGSLQLRNVKTKKQYCDIQNIGEGDALIFDISNDLEHKISPMTGSHPKIAFAGWYCPEPNYERHMSKILDKAIKNSRIIVEPKAVQSQMTAPEITKSIVHRNVGKKIFAVNLADESQCVFNELGARIWQGINNQETTEEMLSSIHRDMDIPLDELQLEYQAVINELTHIQYLKN